MLVAFTVKVYARPLANLLHVARSAVTMHGPAAGDEVTVYTVTGEPPVFTGAVHVTVALAAPGVPATAVGGSGMVRGVIAALGTLGNELPASFVAITVKVYAVPLVRVVQFAVVPTTSHVPPTGVVLTV